MQQAWTRGLRKLSERAATSIGQEINSEPIPYPEEGCKIIAEEFRFVYLAFQFS